MADSDTYAVRVCEFATNRNFDVQLTARSSVAELKKSISELHERKPDESIQKLVLLGKPLNDPTSNVMEIMRGKGIDPAETKTTIHLMLAEPAPASTPAAAGSTSQVQTIRRRLGAAEVGSGDPGTSMGAPGAPPATAPPVPSSFPATSGNPSPQPVPAAAPRAASTQATTGQGEQPNVSSSQTAAPAGTANRSTPATPTRPAVSDPIMMHPIMAAAYNAALCELANGSLDSSRLSAVFPHSTGQGTRQIPLAVPAPLHFSPQYGTQRSQPQTIVINAQNLHLDGSNSNSLRTLLSRANIHLQQQAPGARRDAGAYRHRRAQGRGAAQPNAAGEAGAGADPVAREGGGGAFQRDPDGALRLQMQFHFNLMGIFRGILTIIFMHLILGLSILKVMLLVGTYFLLRALLRLNLHRGIARWFDGVAAHLLQPPGGPAAAAEAPAPAAAAPPAADGAAAADADAAGAPAAGAPHPPPPPPQGLPLQGTMRALVMGLLSFFLSLLPQFNADGADADAIAAAQDDLNNQNNDDVAMAF